MYKCIVGVPREIKPQEGRVGLTPKAARAITELGAVVFIETLAGVASGYSDKEYFDAGAVIVPTAEEVWKSSDILVKVKEPILQEYPLLACLEKKTLFTYLHLAGSDPELTRTLLRHEVTAIAYENVSDIENGRPVYPLLIPMSQIAGVQSMRAAIAHHKEKRPTDLSVVIIGGGNVGEAALKRAISSDVGFVVLFEAWEPRVLELRERYGCDRVVVFPLTMLEEHIGRSYLKIADVVICGPMLPGGKEAPIVLTQRHFRTMKHGCYIADVSIDQGGSTAWTKGSPTKPGTTFTRGARQLIFSAVPNIPGSTVPAEATKALTSATLPYLLRMVIHRLSDPHGDYTSLRDDIALRRGLQTWRGSLVNPHVSSRHKIFQEYRSIDLLF